MTEKVQLKALTFEKKYNLQQITVIVIQSSPGLGR